MVTDELAPVIPVVMSGRTEKRPWPSSRKRGSRQFEPLVSGFSLFQETVCQARVATREPPLVVCDLEDRGLVEDQLGQLRITAAAIVSEPVARNTTSAVAAAALAAGEDRPGALLLVLPCDHPPGDVARVVANLEAAALAAAAGYSVALGLTPGAVARRERSVRDQPRSFEQGRWLRHSGAILVSRRVVLAELGEREAVEPTPVVRRPWGRYRSVDVGDHHQVKRIIVSPGHRLSLQRHRQRSEHWVVVQGTANIVCGDETRVMHENESAFIPVGCAHRLENPGPGPLHLVEVQVGDYLGEDDIERLADDYGRA